MPDTRIDRLVAARQQASRNKHAHTLNTLGRLLQSGTRITFAGVAREAGVSTWLVYNNPELNKAIRNGIERQSQVARQPAGTGTAKPTSPEGLRTDLELARHEIAALRRSERKLRGRLQRTLGDEIEQIDRSELVARITDLETLVATLRTENAGLNETNTRLTQLTAQQTDDLDTTNTLLRRYMKDASRAHPASGN